MFWYVSWTQIFCVCISCMGLISFRQVECKVLKLVQKRFHMCRAVMRKCLYIFCFTIKIPLKHTIIRNFCVVAPLAHNAHMNANCYAFFQISPENRRFLQDFSCADHSETKICIFCFTDRVLWMSYYEGFLHGCVPYTQHMFKHRFFGQIPYYHWFRCRMIIFLRDVMLYKSTLFFIYFCNFNWMSMTLIYDKIGITTLKIETWF